MIRERRIISFKTTFKFIINICYSFFFSVMIFFFQKSCCGGSDAWISIDCGIRVLECQRHWPTDDDNLFVLSGQTVHLEC
jgi:hypothetical protein